MSQKLIIFLFVVISLWFFGIVFFMEHKELSNLTKAQKVVDNDNNLLNKKNLNFFFPGIDERIV